MGCNSFFLAMLENPADNLILLYVMIALPGGLLR